MSKTFEDIIESEPKYRREQIYRALFDPAVGGFGDITTLPKELRTKLTLNPWLPYSLSDLKASEVSDAKKALLKFSDGEVVETVLMARVSKKINSEKEKRYTVCLSTQVGCPMKCAFCATGKIGFKRNLTLDEILAQFRFWQKYLHENKLGKIDNIVFMGQGEPLLNYEPVKESIILFLKYTDIGPRKITLSTAGIISGMDKMIKDPEFPPVRFALSLHSAIPVERKKMMPAQPENFLDFLVSWSKEYHKRWPSRSHFIGIEYVFISGINDDERHLKALVKLLSKLGRVRLNFIPLNLLGGGFKPSEMKVIKEWQNYLMDLGYTVTVRQSQGQDIAAACGQLSNLYYGDKKKKRSI